MSNPITTLIAPPRVSPPSATSSPAETTLHVVACHSPRSASQQQADRHVLHGLESAVGLRHRRDVERAPDVPLDVLVDLEGEGPLGREGLTLPNGDEPSDDGCVRFVETLIERLLCAHARVRRPGCHERKSRSRHYED